MTQPIDPISNMAGHHLSYSICTVLVVLGDTMASAIARPSRQGNGISDNAMSPLLLLQRDCLVFFGVTIDGDGLDLGVTIIAAAQTRECRKSQISAMEFSLARHS